MATMNISLPDQMKDWIENRIELGQYHNASEYVRDLIRKDQAEHEKIQGFIPPVCTIASKDKRPWMKKPRPKARGFASVFRHGEQGRIMAKGKIGCGSRI